MGEQLAITDRVERAERRPFRRARTLLRTLTFVAAFCLAWQSIWWTAAHVVLRAGLPPPRLTLDLLPRLHRWREELRRSHARHRIAMMGDSMVFTEWPGASMPYWVGKEILGLESKEARNSLHVLSWAAWGTAPEYAMVDEIAKAKPDVLVLELNLRLLGPAPLGGVAYTELAGFIDKKRLPEAATLPLSHAGVTLSRLLFYHALVANNLTSRWSKLLERQGLLFETRAPLEEWVDEKFHRHDYADRRFAWGISISGRSLVPRATYSRDSAPHAREALGDVLDGIGEDHPRVVALSAMIKDFVKRGTPVLLWVSPINVDHLKSLGFSMDGVDRSVITLKKVVEGSGARFVDLHSLLHDDSFFDAGDHYTRDGSPSGCEIVGRELGQAIIQEEKSLALQ